MRDPHDSTRRSFIRAGALTLAALVATPALAAARRLPVPDDEPPEAVKKVLRERFGDRAIQKGHVQLDVPEVAPDGRAVPLFIESDLALQNGDYVKGIHIVVDHNPDIYVAGFQLSPAIGGASIDTRIKMRRSSYIRAIVETSHGELWSAASLVYVTLNGCV